MGEEGEAANGGAGESATGSGGTGGDVRCGCRARV